MGKKLYVGNLPYSVADGDLERLFAAHGTVRSAQVIMDRDTGRSKGFGFVEMDSDDQANAAINALNGKEVDGRTLTVVCLDPRQAHLHQLFGGQGAGLERCVDVGDGRRIEVDRFFSGDRRHRCH